MILFEITLILLGFFVTISFGQDNQYKLCVTGKYVDECEQLQRGKSEVVCVVVQDSIECAMKLRNGEADFGVFSAESTLHIGSLDWQDMIVIKQLRHQERQKAETDFESVVVVKSDYNGTLNALQGKKFCHPGLYYGKSQRWSERFLKHFERTVTVTKCEQYKSPAEIEAMTLSTYFGLSCRPGKWSHDAKEDKELKIKYKSLCQLCSGSNCEYADDKSITGPNNNHQKALQCLKNGGDVAYVSHNEAEHFFNKEGSLLSSNYRYLCPDGSLQTVVNNTNETCTWLKQPWKVIISRSVKSVALEKQINNWISKSKSQDGGWESAFARIIDADSHVTETITMEKPVEYIRKYRSIPLPEQLCDTQVKWCTITHEEQDKCAILRQAGITTGVYPLIICSDPAGSTVNCLEDVSKNTSDFVGIDSNFGYLARRMYNLTAVMYYETEFNQYSSVVVVVHDGAKYKRFEELKGAQVCLPEFGATPSIAFINLGKEKKFLNRKECRYHKLLHNFFGESCAPGAHDIKHFRSAVIDDPLCKLCLNENIRENSNNIIGLAVNISTNGFSSAISEGQITCAADDTNRYYGNRGALKCLNEIGDVAILELQSLKGLKSQINVDHDERRLSRFDDSSVLSRKHAKSLMLNENKFRIICRNGSLAIHPGFDVDQNCVLTTIVDGEILIRRGTNKTSGIINVLTALDTYLQSDPDFKMYNIFNGQKHLLFKDSTIGLTAVYEQNVGHAVENYIKLFKNIEDCTQSGAGVKSILSVFTLITFYIIFKIFQI